MRTKRAMYNMVASLVGQLSLVLVTLISRRIFLRTLGADYLGANTLFANILAFLSMAELGIGSAINYSLYKPIAEDNREQIKSLMRLYRYAYWAIGVFILVAGLLLTPVVPLIATGGEGIAHLRLVYLLFLVNTAVSYFFSYKSALIIADQRKYVFMLNHYGWQLAMYLVQIFVLLHWQNYFAYLLIQVAVTVLENAMIAAIVDKNYPFLKEKNVRPLDKATLTEIKKNTSSMVLNKVGNTLITSTDNILLSWLVNVTAVGIYGNYSTISVAAGNVLYQGMYAFVAGLGNLAASGAHKRQREVFDTIALLSVWLYGWCCIGLYIALPPFVKMFYGADMVLDGVVVFMICLNLYISGQTILLNIHTDAMGLYWSLKYKGILEAAINLVLSIILGRIWGLVGILVGTTLSHLLYSFWHESYVVFHEGLHSDVKSFYLQDAKDTLVVLAAAVLTVGAASLVPLEGVAGLAVRLVLAVVLPNAVFVLAFHNRREFREVAGIAKGLLVRFAKRNNDNK